MFTPTKRAYKPFGAPAMPSIQTSQFADDIECESWLREIGLEQYTETFLQNFSVGDALLSRKRLGQLRLKDMPNLNVTNFEHQKLLMAHITHTLQYSFQSPIRRREVRQKYGPAQTNNENKNTNNINNKLNEMKQDLANIKINGSEKKVDHAFAIAPRRRRSFDAKAWQSIEKSRNFDAIKAEAVENIRAGLLDQTDSSKDSSKTQRRRRWTFGDESSEEIVRLAGKGKLYGNMALEYDIMQKELRQLQDEHVNYFRNIIGCERACIFFVNERTRELMLCSDNSWFRIPMGCGVAGYCAETGESLKIDDAYGDHRFNRNVDLKIGFRTRNILCQPVRAHRGGGSIVAVIQMLNKVNAPTFDDHDVDALATCAQRVADDLSARFKELLHAAEKFAGHAIFVGSSYGSEKRSVDAPTMASISSRAARK